MPEPGTVVMLKSGGPRMTTGVPAPRRGPHGEIERSDSKVWCYWFQCEVPKQQQFNIAHLKEVTDYGDLATHFEGTVFFQSFVAGMRTLPANQPNLHETNSRFTLLT